MVDTSRNAASSNETLTRKREADLDRASYRRPLMPRIVPEVSRDLEVLKRLPHALEAHEQKTAPSSGLEGSCGC